MARNRPDDELAEAERHASHENFTRQLNKIFDLLVMANRPEIPLSEIEPEWELLRSYADTVMLHYSTVTSRKVLVPLIQEIAANHNASPKSIKTVLKELHTEL